MEFQLEGPWYERYLTVKYKTTPIAEARLESNSSKLTFTYRNGQVITHDITKHVIPSTAYLDQFGISLSEDGTLFFIQSWQKGLFCFDMHSGKLKWHHKLKKAYNLVVLRDTVVCRFAEQCVMELDISTGQMRNRIPLGPETDFLTIGDTRYLIGPKRMKYQIIDENLNIIASIPYESFNPNDYRTFIINRADSVPGGIEIHGFEYEELKEKPKHYRFSRIVPCDLQEEDGSSPVL